MGIHTLNSLTVDSCLSGSSWMNYERWKSLMNNKSIFVCVCVSIGCYKMTVSCLFCLIANAWAHMEWDHKTLYEIDFPVKVTSSFTISTEFNQIHLTWEMRRKNCRQQTTYRVSAYCFAVHVCVVMHFFFHFITFWINRVRRVSSSINELRSSCEYIIFAVNCIISILVLNTVFPFYQRIYCVRPFVAQCTRKPFPNAFSV